MEKFGENKLEVEIEELDISPIFDEFKCLGEDEFHEEYLELPGYIIEFEEASIHSFSHYDKPIFSKIRGIKLERNGVGLRQKIPLLVSEMWDWDSFPWDPGGFVNVCFYFASSCLYLFIFSTSFIFLSFVHVL